ncbi:peptidylprolyl isomerase [Scytonema hofmannii PCC 7110]|uniref:peptidylprolyl isomerase n=1 Tax=Scytonema hofmannii PCC 7110 TaxID=128403 RepID=A0A139X023_9CYAN|nr:peptidylprolyl isomerase [Scytonema hofmannii]KYC38055.1 peptidylprolyl isomerase [Scytonema hofmannii PCC 7110]
MEETLEKFTLQENPSATHAEIIAYLQRSCKIAEIAALAERDALILRTCEQFDITVSDEELQVAGDAFRLEHKLLGASETLAWVEAQQITIEDWSEGIRVSLLTKKLREHLFGAAVDGQYVGNREQFKRVALSQIIVLDEIEAVKIATALREENASFYALAVAHSKGKKSQENGGFVGIQFIAELMKELVDAIANVKEGEVVGPIRTKLGYHIIRVEKWFPPQLNESVKERIMEPFFQAWLQQQGS